MSAPTVSPEDFATYCTIHQNPEHADLVVNAWVEVIERHQVSVATQVALVAFLVSMLEQESPIPGVVRPALTLLIDRTIATQRLAASQPHGQA